MTAEKVKALEKEAEKGGMQISGAEIFREEDKQEKVTRESDLFGKQDQSKNFDNSPKNDAENKTESKAQKEDNLPSPAKKPSPKDFAGLGKHQITTGIDVVAETVRHFVENLRHNDAANGVITGLAANYGDNIVKQAENMSQYFEKRDWREIRRDTESFARRNPAAFIGGAFLLGLLGARFLKSGTALKSPKNNLYNSDNS